MTLLMHLSCRFIGKAVMNQLNKEGVNAVEINLRDHETASSLQHRLISANCTCLVHLAGRLPTTDPKQQDEIEALTVELANRCLQAVSKLPHKCSFVFASTVRVYPLGAGSFNFDIEPAPFDGYGKGKLRVEQLAKSMASPDRPVTILRVSSVCGIFRTKEGSHEARGLAPILVQCAKKNGQIRVAGDGTATKDLIHVDDCANAIWLAISNPPERKNSFQRNVLIGSGEPLTVNAVALKVADMLGSKVEIVHGPEIANDLAGAVDPEPAWRNLNWKPKKNIDDIISEAIAYMGASHRHVG